MCAHNTTLLMVILASNLVPQNISTEKKVLHQLGTPIVLSAARADAELWFLIETAVGCHFCHACGYCPSFRASTPLAGTNLLFTNFVNRSTHV